jgi:3D (Asp-Asp-Asp) domain-containing protein
MRMAWAWLLAAALWTAGCATPGRYPPGFPGPRPAPPPHTYTLETTAYCACGQCCGWHRDRRGRAVISAGPRRGKPKDVGITASGTRARRGTIAADTRRFPFGTIMYVPGYGYGRVEDCGRDITANRIDLFFPRHSDAVGWGRVRVPVTVWFY